MPASCTRSTGRCCLPRQGPGWSSSTQRLPGHGRTLGRPDGAGRRGRSLRRRHRQPALLHRRMGPGHGRARSARPRLAGSAHGRAMPGDPLAGDPHLSQRLADQDGVAARAGRSPAARATSASAPVDCWLVWKLSGGSLHVTDVSNVGGRALVRRSRGLEREDPGGVSHPAPGTARDRRLVGRDREGQRASRRPADRRDCRRSAGLAGRAGVRAAGHGEDHLRYGRHARSMPRRAAPRLRRRRARRQHAAGSLAPPG